MSRLRFTINKYSFIHLRSNPIAYTRSSKCIGKCHISKSICGRSISKAITRSLTWKPSTKFQLNRGRTIANGHNPICHCNLFCIRVHRKKDAHRVPTNRRWGRTLDSCCIHMSKCDYGYQQRYNKDENILNYGNKSMVVFTYIGGHQQDVGIVICTTWK